MFHTSVLFESGLFWSYSRSIRLFQPGSFQGPIAGVSRFGPTGVGHFGPISKVGRFGPILGVSRFGLIYLFLGYRKDIRLSSP